MSMIQAAQIILNDSARLLPFIMLASKNTSCDESYKTTHMCGWACVITALLPGCV